MKINKLKINSYGKLKNKEINLENNINIIYGENESGKSTLLKFILNIFYGSSKNKKGRDISDFEKYKPWNSEEFSGKLTYELENKNKYEIYREFNKKSPIIYNEKGEDISKEFNIDKNKGNEFFYNQTQITEEMFLSTSIAMQQEIKIGKEMQNILIQKISNLLGTGEDRISYKKAIDKLNKKQLDEIGTERSKEKPINIIKKKIDEKEILINELKKYENIKYEIEEEKNIIKNKLEKNIIKNNILKEIKKIKEKNKIEEEKIKIKENIIEENLNKIKEIKNEKNNLEKNYYEKNKTEKNINEKNEKNKLNNKIKKIGVFLVLLNILYIIITNQFLEKNIIKYAMLVTIPIYLIFTIFLKNKLNNKIKNQIKIIENYKKIEYDKYKTENNNLENQIKIIEKNNMEILEEINKIKINKNCENNMEKEKIKNKYYLEINLEEISKLLNENNLDQEKEYLENKINNQKIELSKLDIKKENIEPQIDNLSNIEEELVSLKEQYKNLEKINDSIELTKLLLEKAYEKMKNNVSPIFTEKLSKNISEITKGKYKQIYFNDEKGLIVELDNGSYIPAERLSTGTIDQLYLSLRLAILDEISQEKVPIILDEAFAYYDINRLKNILIYLSKEFRDRQIIILTCTNREKEILKSEKILYNYICL